jgi:hypothetical protein
LLRGNGGCAVDIAHRGVVCGIKLLIYKEKWIKGIRIIYFHST